MSSQNSKSGDIFKLTLYRQVEPYRGDETGYIIEPVDKKNLPVELWEICYGWDEAKHAVTCYTYFDDEQKITRKIALNELKEALSQYFTDAIKDVEDYVETVNQLEGTFNYL